MEEDLALAKTLEQLGSDLRHVDDQITQQVEQASQCKAELEEKKEEVRQLESKIEEMKETEASQEDKEKVIQFQDAKIEEMQEEVEQASQCKAELDTKQAEVTEMQEAVEKCEQKYEEDLKEGLKELQKETDRAEDLELKLQQRESEIEALKKIVEQSKCERTVALLESSNAELSKKESELAGVREELDGCKHKLEVAEQNLADDEIDEIETGHELEAYKNALAEANKKLEEATENDSQWKSRAAELTKCVASFRRLKSESETKIASLTSEINKLLKKQEEMEQAIAERDAEIAKLKFEIKTLNAGVEYGKEIIKKQRAEIVKLEATKAPMKVDGDGGDALAECQTNLEERDQVIEEIRGPEVEAVGIVREYAGKTNMSKMFNPSKFDIPNAIKRIRSTYDSTLTEIINLSTKGLSRHFLSWDAKGITTPLFSNSGCFSSLTPYVLSNGSPDLIRYYIDVVKAMLTTTQSEWDGVLFGKNGPASATGFLEKADEDGGFKLASKYELYFDTILYDISKQEMVIAEESNRGMKIPYQNWLAHREYLNRSKITVDTKDGMFRTSAKANIKKVFESLKECLLEIYGIYYVIERQAYELPAESPIFNGMIVKSTHNKALRIMDTIANDSGELIIRHIYATLHAAVASSSWANESIDSQSAAVSYYFDHLTFTPEGVQMDIDKVGGMFDIWVALCELAYAMKYITFPGISVDVEEDESLAEVVKTEKELENILKRKDSDLFMKKERKDHPTAYIQYDSFSTLNPNKELDGNVIDYYLELIHDEIPDIRGKTWDIIPSSMMAGDLTGVKLDPKVDYLMSPIFTGNHWMLAWVDVNAGNITIYDSLDSVSIEYRAKSIEKFAKFIESNFKKDFKAQVDDSVQQTDATSCGLFVCLQAKILAIGKEGVKANIKDPNHLRWRMAYEIYTGSLD